MRIWMRRGIALVLVMTLLCSGSVAFATEAGTEPVSTEMLPVETAPPETEAPTEPPTEPETEPPTEPEPASELPLPEVWSYTVDTETEIYSICDSLSEGMDFDQLLVFDATNNEILYTNSRESTKLYPASITKLFSAYVALLYLDPHDVVTVGNELSLVHPGSSVAYLGRGHQMYVQTVVEAMMLPSGNDAAMVLATAAGRKIAEDSSLEPSDAVTAFVREMNRIAKELGFEKSHFANPDGWHSGSHYTCLNDMARVAKLALDNKTISRYIRRYEDEVTLLSGHTVTWENTNLLLSPEDGYYRGDAIGMKTGYTRQAENSLMSAFRCDDGRNLVIGLFGYADGNQRFRDAIKIAKACKEQFGQEAKAAAEAEKAEKENNG